MKRFVTILLLLFAASTMTLLGCKDKFVPYVVDADEVKRFIEESETGEQLFMWDSLILPTPYHLPFTSATFRDSVVGHDRTYLIAVPDTLDSLPTPLGFIRHASALVQDKFSVRTERVSGVDTTVVTTDRIIKRLGWFYKLGNDYEPYRGWYLWYFQGQDSAYVPGFSTLMRFPHLAPFSVDPSSSIKINEMRIIGDTTTIILDTKSTNPSAPLQPAPVITMAHAGGLDQQEMIRIDSLNYTDTTRTPANSTRKWNLIFVQSFHDNQFFFRGGFVIPYRAPN